MVKIGSMFSAAFAETVKFSWERFSELAMHDWLAHNRAHLKLRIGSWP